MPSAVVPPTRAGGGAASLAWQNTPAAAAQTFLLGLSARREKEKQQLAHVKPTVSPQDVRLPGAGSHDAEGFLLPGARAAFLTSFCALSRESY